MRTAELRMKEETAIARREKNTVKVLTATIQDLSPNIIEPGELIYLNIQSVTFSSNSKQSMTFMALCQILLIKSDLKNQAIYKLLGSFS
uniref:hypothetical protein n=1 Tax=Lactobacillus jensenii TaxID=109790 RepID=UPI002870228F